jgi:metal-responsive CopG/Arc/MetJ family transcriptional regulator
MLEASASIGKRCGYTSGMKTAVSIPDKVFERAERLARRTKKSRSQLFSDALKEYVARHAPDDVTEAMNRVCDEIGDTRDEFVAAAARRTLERSEW